MYAAGKIPGGFIKRESRPSEQAILACRLTDRPIRPLFPEGYKDDVQIVITVLSTDQENQPDILGTFAASCALTISEIPFLGPIGAVRIGRIDGEFVVNPTVADLERSDIDLVVSGTRDAIMMVEAGASIVPEDVMAEAILFGHRAIQPLIDIQEEMRAAVGKPKSVGYLEPGTGSVLEFVKKASQPGFEVVVLDVETTGRDPKVADLIEIGAVRVRDGQIVDRFSTFVSPGREIFGAQMHGITTADVAGAPVAREAAEKLLAFVGGSPVIGHNVGFDLGFLDAALGETGKFIAGGYFDTLVIAREAYPDLESYKLGDIARFFGIEVATAHRGLADAETTAAIVARFADDLSARIANLQDAIAISIRANRKEGEDPAGLLDAARRQARVSKSLFQLVQKKTVRNAGPRRGDPNGRPRRGRAPADLRGSRRSAARPRLGPLHPRPDPGSHGGHARPGLRRPAHRHDQPGDREAVPPPLQHAAIQHR